MLVAVCGLWVAVRAGGVEPPWPGSALLAFTPWVVVPAVVGLGVAATIRDRWATAAAAATVLVLALVVVPRSWGTGGESDGVVLRVMTANLRVGGADATTIVDLVRDNRIDVLALQEYTPEAGDAFDRAGLAALLPYRVADPEPLGIGSALFARTPLTGGATPVDPGGFVEATATVHPAGAAAVMVRSVHPCAPYTRAHERCWQRGLAGEPRATTRGTARLLMGDFNATLDHPGLRRLLASGYRDAAATTGTGLKPTWPEDLVPVATLDHVLVDARIGVRTVSVHPVPDTDHRAVCAVLTLPGQPDAG
ncbi:endonuclease/exonuclease/phosphatase family protein [Rugosimonospora africana]|uniref:Endonuclease n=1 Tax=Rugosimonospora africana TaxID=556532 RepID=A0A8J3QRW8_9ACTN|nr:endonuclease/exonuclease/phosphatase family protein [Rugosimonospora africana]GIH14438.1 endonuclease [Rugosimonospora africana]